MTRDDSDDAIDPVVPTIMVPALSCLGLLDRESLKDLLEKIRQHEDHDVVHMQIIVRRGCDPSTTVDYCVWINDEAGPVPAPVQLCVSAPVDLFRRIVRLALKIGPMDDILGKDAFHAESFH